MSKTYHNPEKLTAEVDSHECDGCGVQVVGHRLCGNPQSPICSADETYEVGFDLGFEAGHQAGYDAAITDAIENPEAFTARLQEIRP